MISIGSNYVQNRCTTIDRNSPHEAVLAHNRNGYGFAPLVHWSNRLVGLAGTEFPPFPRNQPVLCSRRFLGLRKSLLSSGAIGPLATPTGTSGIIFPSTPKLPAHDRHPWLDDSGSVVQRRDFGYTTNASISSAARLSPKTNRSPSRRSSRSENPTRAGGVMGSAQSAL